MKIFVCGGFLGAGKTTAIKALAASLQERGERVSIITNDQGDLLVDSARLTEQTNLLWEIGGGCFCCQYDELETSLIAAEEAGATVAIAEAVGSCTDLVATVLSPLVERQSPRFEIAPLAVVVDPWRLKEVDDGLYPRSIAYLFRKQIEEADLIILTRSDLNPPDVRSELAVIRPGAPILSVSGITGDGISQWSAQRPKTLAAPLHIDYDEYAAAEALLGWANGVVLIQGDPFSPRAVIGKFFEKFRNEPVAHLKISVGSPAIATASQVRPKSPPTEQLDDLPELCSELELTINARVALDPDELAAKLKASITIAAAGLQLHWSHFECFSPGRPVPVHRHSERHQADPDASCCAAFYQRPDVQYLLGDSWHPGGARLTETLGDELSLNHGDSVLDVACGLGTSLRVIAKNHEIEAFGLDINPPTSESATDVTFHRGNVHDIPFDADSVEGIICECALSTFTDQPLALSEMHRVLRKGGRIAISDMVVNGAVPEALAEWTHVGTCLSHARSMSDYQALLENAGFDVLKTEDCAWALSDMLRRIKRRLLGAALAKSTGVLPAAINFDLKKGRDAIRLAEAAIASAAISYGYLIARKARTQ